MLRLWPAVAALLLVAGGAFAALNVESSSTLTVSARTAPVVFELGDGAAKSRYVAQVAVSGNGTSFAAGVQGRLGGDATVKDVVELVSVASETRTVNLRGTQVTNANVPIHTWTVRSGTTTIATLDMRHASPSATFTIPAGQTYELDMRIKVVRGIAASDATFSSSVWAVVT